EAAPAVPSRTVRIQLVLQQPGPGEVACACVRACAPGTELDQFVEQPDGPSDEPAELCAVQHGAGARIDAERPWRVRGVAGANVARMRISSGNSCIQITPPAGEPVEEQVAETQPP